MPHNVETPTMVGLRERSEAAIPRSVGRECQFLQKEKPVRSTPIIAVVDDDDDLRAALAELIQSIGYDVTQFENADAFLATATLTEIDCIISDIHMPGTNGLKLARMSREWDKPVILITAFPSAELERQATEAGVLCFLRKPFDPVRLIDQLTQLLD